MKSISIIQTQYRKVNISSSNAKINKLNPIKSDKKIHSSFQFIIIFIIIIIQLVYCVHHIRIMELENE